MFLSPFKRVTELLLGDFSGTSGAGASGFQVKAKRALAVEGASRVHAAGSDGTGVLLALIHIWAFKASFNIFWLSDRLQTRADTLTLAACGSGPGLQAVAGEPMAVIAHTHPAVHTRVGGTRVSCGLTVDAQSS